MNDRQLSPKDIAEHREFLARITAEARQNVLGLIDPRAQIAAGGEIDALIRAAREEVAFLHRVGIDPDEEDFG